MDEFKSMKSVSGARSFICVDGTTNRLFTILEDRRLVKLTQYFMRFPRKARLKINYLVMDMNASYNQLLKTVFLNAEIVTDRFHIMQHINRSFNQLWITEIKNSTTKRIFVHGYGSTPKRDVSVNTIISLDKQISNSGKTFSDWRGANLYLFYDSEGTLSLAVPDVDVGKEGQYMEYQQ